MLMPACLCSRCCAGVLDRNAPLASLVLKQPHPTACIPPLPAGMPPSANAAARPVHAVDANATCALRLTGPAPPAPPAAAPSSPAAAMPSLHRPAQIAAPTVAPTACPPSNPPAAKQPPAATSAPPLSHLPPAARLPNSTAASLAPTHKLPIHLPPLASPFSVAILTPCTGFSTQPGSVLLPAIALPSQAAADWIVLHPSVHAALSLVESTAALTHTLSAGHSTNATTVHPPPSSQAPAAVALLRRLAATPGADWLAITVAGEPGALRGVWQGTTQLHAPHTATALSSSGVGWALVLLISCGWGRSLHLPNLCRRRSCRRNCPGAAYVLASLPQPH